MELNEELRSLAEFAKNLSVDSQISESVFRDFSVLISRGDRTVILAGEEGEKYTEIVSSIYQAVSTRRPVSKRSVSDLVGSFLLRVVNVGVGQQDAPAEDAEAALRELKTALFENPKDWEVRLVVEGLAPSGLPSTVGQVHFEYLDDGSLSKLKDRVFEMIKNMRVKDGDAAIAHMSNNLAVLLGKTTGVLTVSAVDDEAAIQAAKHKMQTTVDAINFFASREQMGGWVFLPGDTMPQTEFVLAICEKEERITPSFRRAGPMRQLPLNQIANRKGFARVSGILAKEAPPSLEERILASLQWAGRAQVEARREEAFLLYAIALESLLLGRDTKTEISHRLAVRCAHLGGGPTANDKKRVVREILSLYETRSRIVHSGNFLVSDAELALIKEYSVLTLFVVIDAEPFRSMTEVRELEQWFETQLLSGGISRT
jgi:hypothetical protein